MEILNIQMNKPITGRLVTLWHKSVHLFNSIQLKFFQIFCATLLIAVVSFITTKLVFHKFQEEGLVVLGQSINIVGICTVLGSLAINSGLIRKLSNIKIINLKILMLALICIYLFGIFLLLGWFFAYFTSLTASIILFSLLCLPITVLRSYLIATGKQVNEIFVNFSLIVSFLVSVLYSNTPDQILNNAILFQSTVMVLCITSFLMFSDFSSKNFKIRRTDFSQKTAKSVTIDIAELLRFSTHSVASGIQQNQSMIVGRLFLINFVGYQFSGQMEMYQRPVIWVFSACASVASLLFYPYVIQKVQDQKINPIEEKLFINKIMKKIVIYGASVLIVLTVCFPILFGLTFGFHEDISLFFAAFWIASFLFRFLAVLFSSWCLAKNEVKAAMIGEGILYLPSIVIFMFFLNLGTSSSEYLISVYFVTIGLSGFAQMVYFYFVLLIPKNQSYKNEKSN